jgi:transcriptional regulator with XRE-family HTH domain
MTMAGRIRERREHLGLTQEQVGHHFGISREAVQQWEKKGGTTPRGKRLRALADLLQCGLRWLITGEGDPHVRESPLESRLIDTFRTLPEGDQAVVILLADSLARRLVNDDGNERRAGTRA